MQATICEISQIAQPPYLWEISHMGNRSSGLGLSASLVAILESARPFDDEKGRPLSDNRWCELAEVSPGFWRDLRKGAEPGIDKVQRMARVAGLSLAELEARSRAALPSAEKLTEAMAGLLDSVGLHDLSEKYAEQLALRLPAVLAEIQSPVEQPGRDEPRPRGAPSQAGATQRRGTQP